MKQLECAEKTFKAADGNLFFDLLIMLTLCSHSISSG